MSICKLLCSVLIAAIFYMVGPLILVLAANRWDVGQMGAKALQGMRIS